MMMTALSILVGVVVLCKLGHADDALCYDQQREYGGLSFAKVRSDCEADPEIKGRPVPVMKCIFKTGEVALNPEETYINYPVLETLAGVFATDEKLAFIKEKLELCKNKVNADPTAIQPFFQCCADEIVEKCKDFEGQIRRD